MIDRLRDQRVSIIRIADESSHFIDGAIEDNLNIDRSLIAVIDQCLTALQIERIELTNDLLVIIDYLNLLADLKSEQEEALDQRELLTLSQEVGYKVLAVIKKYGGAIDAYEDITSRINEQESRVLTSLGMKDENTLLQPGFLIDIASRLFSFIRVNLVRVYCYCDLRQDIIAENVQVVDKKRAVLLAANSTKKVEQWLKTLEEIFNKRAGLTSEFELTGAVPLDEDVLRVRSNRMQVTTSILPMEKIAMGHVEPDWLDLNLQLILQLQEIDAGKAARLVETIRQWEEKHKTIVQKDGLLPQE